MNKRWIHRAEQFCIDSKMVLLHDGLNNPGQFKLPPEDIRFYTMVYQAVMDGRCVNTFFKFKYDLRDRLNFWMSITFRDPTKKTQRVEMIMENPEEVVNHV